MKTKIVLILVALALVAPVLAANVTYPEEYYVLKVKADRANDGIITSSIDSVFYELRRQTYLMEKQNELLAEQNNLLEALLVSEQNEILEAMRQRRSESEPSFIRNTPNDCVRNESIYGPVYTCTYWGNYRVGT